MGPGGNARGGKVKFALSRFKPSELRVQGVGPPMMYSHALIRPFGSTSPLGTHPPTICFHFGAVVALAGLQPLLPSYHPALPAAVLVVSGSFLEAGAEAGRLEGPPACPAAAVAAAAASSAAFFCALTVRCTPTSYPPPRTEIRNGIAFTHFLQCLQSVFISWGVALLKSFQGGMRHAECFV